jgi:hypothetical protein
MRWRGFTDVEYRGEMFGQRDREFPRYLQLPQQVNQKFLLAVPGTDSEILEEHGWQVTPGESATRTPDQFRDFVYNSRAEFGVAKHAYAATRCGWFSDRSVCYLASGRPVLLRDTGQSDTLPVGKGLLTFANLAEAVDGVLSINADYRGHAAAARRIAEQHFDARIVLPDLLEKATA